MARRKRHIPAGILTLLLAAVIGGGGFLLAAFSERLLPDDTGRVHVESMEAGLPYPDQTGHSGPVVLYPWQQYEAEKIRPLTDAERRSALLEPGIAEQLYALLPGERRDVKETIDILEYFVAIDVGAPKLSTVFYLKGAALELVEPMHYSVQTYLVDCAVLPGQGIVSFHYEPELLVNRAADNDEVAYARKLCQMSLGVTETTVEDDKPSDGKQTWPSYAADPGEYRQVCWDILRSAFVPKLDGVGALDRLRELTVLFGKPEWLTTSREIGIVYTLSATSNIVLTYDALTDRVSGFSLRLDD